jgi:hypothetical protein
MPSELVRALSLHLKKIKILKRQISDYIKKKSVFEKFSSMKI